MRTDPAAIKSRTRQLRFLAVGLALSLALVACGGGGSGGGGGGGGGGGSDRGVAVTPGSFSLEVGETQLLEAVVDEGAGVQDVDWSSSDVAVATIDASGMVRAVGAGDAVITAVSQADSSLSGTSEVEVTAPSCRAPVVIDEDIITPTNLGRLDHALGCTDYVVRFMNDVREAVTIAAGVTLEFDMGAGFFVIGGSLSAVGTAVEPVVFKGLPGAATAWRGLVFASASGSNRLEHALFSDTGAPVADAVYPLTLRSSIIVTENNQVSIIDTQFRGGEGNGVWLDKRATMPEFSGNAFAGHGAAPIALDFSQVQYIGTGNSLKGPTDNPNGAEVVELIARQLLETDATISALEVPYHLDGLYEIDGSVLTIEPGVELRFAEGASLAIDDQGATLGALNAAGTAENRIVMTADVNDADPDHWNGILILATGPSQIQNTHIGFGGGNQTAGIFPNQGANIIVSGDGVLDITDSHLHDAPMCLERIAGGMLLITGSGNTTAACDDSDMP